uniref:PAP-associated domain-containing protein n=2 Tax=Lotharella globosa TaxID=91324 RepID=A0A7S3YYC5_9EUKA
MAPLAVVLKCFLKTLPIGLADPFKGGLSSYALVLMLAAVLRLRSELKRHFEGFRFATDDVKGGGGGVEGYGDLAEAFLLFLETYGPGFDPAEDLVVVFPPPPPPALPPWLQLIKRGGKRESAFEIDTLAVIDPLDPTNNTARSAYRFPEVQSALTQALTRLRATADAARRSFSAREVKSTAAMATEESSQGSPSAGGGDLGGPSGLADGSTSTGGNKLNKYDDTSAGAAKATATTGRGEKRFPMLESFFGGDLRLGESKQGRKRT